VFLSSGLQDYAHNQFIVIFPIIIQERIFQASLVNETRPFVGFDCPNVTAEAFFVGRRISWCAPPPKGKSSAAAYWQSLATKEPESSRKAVSHAETCFRSSCRTHSMLRFLLRTWCKTLVSH
jgi:hypothetical protein